MQHYSVLTQVVVVLLLPLLHQSFGLHVYRHKEKEEEEEDQSELMSRKTGGFYCRSDRTGSALHLSHLPVSSCLMACRSAGQLLLTATVGVDIPP